MAFCRAPVRDPGHSALAGPAAVKRGHHLAHDLVARPFQDHDVSPRMVNGRSMERPAHRVASVTSVRPAIRSAPIARLRRAAMTLGPFRVLTLDLSSWYKVSRSQ